MKTGKHATDVFKMDIRSCQQPENGVTWLCSSKALTQIKDVSLSANYKLSKNIDLQGQTFSKSVIDGVFTGELKGNGKTNSNTIISFKECYHWIV